VRGGLEGERWRVVMNRNPLEHLFRELLACHSVTSRAFEAVDQALLNHVSSLCGNSMHNYTHTCVYSVMHSP
jgi:hypothetical protein